MRPVLQSEEDVDQAQAHPQPQQAHGRVPALPQEVHQKRLPQGAHGERPRRDRRLAIAKQHQRNRAKDELKKTHKP